LYRGFVERLTAAIPLSLFIFSLKEQARRFYESGQSSIELSGMVGLRRK
jgi:hypothetical protein